MSGALFRRALRAGKLPGQRLGWRLAYDVLSLVWRDADWRFMNYGWLAEGEVAAEPEAVSAGLYRAALGDLPLHGARILEVGSGRGGGAAWLARQEGVAGVTGLDLSPRTVARARRLNPGIAGLEFRQGDAEALPFPDACFDGVVNVESSHCYPHMPRFLAEVARVLRPGGWFAWADMRPASALPGLDATFTAAGLAVAETQELTGGVLRALAAAEQRKAAMIRRFRPTAGLMREFAGMEGSMLRGALQRGQVRYLAKRCRKI